MILEKNKVTWKNKTCIDFCCQRPPKSASETCPQGNMPSTEHVITSESQFRLLWIIKVIQKKSCNYYFNHSNGTHILNLTNSQTIKDNKTCLVQLSELILQNAFSKKLEQKPSLFSYNIIHFLAKIIFDRGHFFNIYLKIRYFEINS